MNSNQIPSGMNRNILFIDDEPLLLKSLGRIASRNHWEAQLADSPEKGLAVIQEKKFAIIVSDHRMPGMTGTEVLAKVKSESKDSIRILLTGYADVGAAIQAVNQSEVYKYLTKPWNEESLVQVIEEAFEQFHLKEENRILQLELEKATQELQVANIQLENKVKDRTNEIQKLNQQIESSFLGSIKLMGLIAHERDENAGARARRVSSLSVSVGREMGLKPRQLFELQVAGYLHNLSQKNKDPFKNAIRSSELMENIPNLGEAYLYVRQIYERYDGKGSQKSSKGNEIPIGSRILAVVIAYDELMSPEQSDSAMTAKKAIHQLKEQSTTRFDPECIAALFTCLEKLGLTQDRHFETTVSLYGLMPGMILSKDLKSVSGRNLILKDTVIQQEDLGRLMKRHAEDPIEPEIFVYRDSRKRSSI